MVGYKRNYQKHCKKNKRSSANCNCNFNCFNSSSSSCDDSDYIIETRTQFTVIQSAENICNLTTMISDECISLDGYFLQSLNDNCSLFSFTIGDENEQKSQSLGIVRCILKKLCICFLEDEVLRIIPPTSGPGTFAKLYCQLTSNDIEVYNAYPSANGEAIYIEPSCINEAKCIL